MASEVKGREWDISPGPDGEPFINWQGSEVLGWHERHEGQDELKLAAEFEAYFHELAQPAVVDVSLTLRPILMREASDVECRIEGWEEGTWVPCTPRAKESRPMWQIEIEAAEEPPMSKQGGEM